MTKLTPFADDTAVVEMAPGRYRAELPEHWLSLVGIHGGYSAAVVARAVEATVADPQRSLRSLAVQFAAAPEPGPAEVEVTVERAGRSMTTTSARLRQAGRLLLVAHAVSAPNRPGIVYDELERPAPPDPGKIPIFTSPGGVRHFDNVEIRLHPGTQPFAAGPEARLAAWLRPQHGEAISAAWLVAMADILPPAVFARTNGPVNAASLEYTVHLATGRPSLPPDGHAFLDCRSALAGDGFAVEDATLWDPEGRVLAMARQTRLAGSLEAGARGTRLG